MKPLERLWACGYGSITIVTALAIAAASSSSWAEQTSQRPSQYSDEELFHGIILAHGPVARLLPELADITYLEDAARSVMGSKFEAPLERFHQDVIRAVAKSDPAFLKEFGAAMRSGDHIRIDSMLKRARETCRTAISKMPEVRELQERLKKDPELRKKIEASVNAHESKR